MIRLLVFLAVAIVLALVGVWLADNPGQVVVDWLGYRIDTSVGILAIALLAFAFVVVVLFEILRLLRFLPRRVGRGWRRRKTARGYDELSAGLIAAAAGDAAAANLHRRHAERLIPGDPAVMLLGAQAAQLGGRDDEARSRFRQMLGRPETEFLGLRGLLAQAAKTGDREDALELARRAYRRNHDTAWPATTLFDLLTKAEHWEEALPLVDDLQRLGVLGDTDARRDRAALDYLAGQRQAGLDEPVSALKRARRALKSWVAFTPAAVLAARMADRLDRPRQARRLLESAWDVRPHPDLAKAYADLAPEEAPTDRLKRFERLRRENPGHVETHLTMAEVAIAAHRYDVARRQLEQAVERGQTARTCRLMAELERAEGGDPARIQDWLAKAADAKPDPAWVAEDSGETFPEWRPFGPDGRFNRLVWTIPPRVRALALDETPTFVLTHGPQEVSTAAAAEQPGSAAERQPSAAAA
jgi:HemY protein